MKKLVVVVAAVALSFAASGIEIVGRMQDQGQRSAIMLQGRLNGCLAAFAEVDDRAELWEVRRYKRNKLYREYDEAVKLAKMILRRYDNSIDRASAEEHAIPAFWIDMSLLYEHYVLGALRKAYGSKILYQANVTTGKPDFLYVDGERPLILDTKYKPRYGAGTFDVEDIRQLAGYARDRKALKKLGMQEAEEQSSAVVPCVIIYPEVRGGDVKFDGLRSPIDQVKLEVAPIGELVGFYRVGFPLPVLSAGVTDGLRRGAGNFYVSGEADLYDSQTCTDLERLAVLHLSDDQGALFGKSWSKKEAKT